MTDDEYISVPNRHNNMQGLQCLDHLIEDLGDVRVTHPSWRSKHPT